MNSIRLNKEIKETIEVLFEQEEVLKMTSNLTKILDKEFEERKIKGEIKGEIKAKEEDALNFLKLGVSEEIVAKGTGLSLKRVLELKGKLN
jgi:predicted transposase/invertase (TIGR01784 family)